MTQKRRTEDHFIEEILDSLGWEGQVGQLAQIDINLLLTDDHTQLRQDLLDHYIGTLGVGSVLNNQNRADPLWKMEDFRAAVLQIQETAQKFGRPPVIWGLDSVHGANYIYDTIITPQPINLAASFNSSLAYQAGLWASRDTRRAGIPWLFSPLLGLSWNPFWSRVYETFGEDPTLVGKMALAMTEGIQATTDDNSTIVPSRAAACGKHFIGYSMPRDGHDHAPSWIPTRHLYQYFVPPWKQVAGLVDTIMESYTEVDGVPNVANRQTLQRLLRKELGFEGMLVTDYHEIFNLFEWHHTAKDRTDALIQSLTEGTVDMSMIANEPEDFFKAFTPLSSSSQWKERVRTSARRVLELKQKLNMFEESFDLTMGDSSGPGHSKVDIEQALDMTHQSIILVKNQGNVLPLNSDDLLRVLVTGPTANSKSFMTGGWTWQWQGVDSNMEDQWFTYGSTVADALHQQRNWQVSYSCGVDILGRDCDSSRDFHGEAAQDPGVMDKIKGWVGWNGQEPELSIERAMAFAANHDVIVVCVGEENYTEKPGDIRTLRLPDGQYELVAGLREAAPSAKIVLVYFGGRPRLLKQVESMVDAIFLGFLPGPLAGDALVDLITGRVNPSAKLPITYPKYEDGGGIPYLHAVSDMCTEDNGDVLPHWTNGLCEVQWPFGHGLSYSNFKYETLLLSTTELSVGRGSNSPELTITAKITNPSNIPGAFPVMIFSFDMFRSTTPEYKRLRAFEKIWMEANSTQEVSFTISIDDLHFIGNHDERHYVLEDGMEFVIGVGPEVDCRTDPRDKRCSVPVRITTDPDYVSACDAACSLWSSSGCAKQAGLEQDKCLDMCSSIHFEENVEMNNDGWGWNYVGCLESIIWEDSFHHDQDCWKLTTLCRNVLASPLMDEYGHGMSTLAVHSDQASLLVVTLALFSGILASVMVFVAMRGGFKKPKSEYGDVQFSAVRTHDLMLD